MITQLLYSRILNMNKGSLHIRSFRRLHFSVFRYMDLKWLYRSEKFPGLSRNRPLATYVYPILLYRSLNSSILFYVFHVSIVDF